MQEKALKPYGAITLHSEPSKEPHKDGIIEGVTEVAFSDKENTPKSIKDLSPDSIMGVGSIGKMFTKAAVYQLAEPTKTEDGTISKDGIIKLDALATSYFPDSDDPQKNDRNQKIRALFTKSGAEEAKVSDLINHTSGLLPMKMMEFDKEDKNKIIGGYVLESEKNMAGKATVDDVVTNYMGTEPNSILGGKPSYNNVNYILLGQLIENQTGQSFKDVVHERVIERLGLKNTGYVGHGNLKGRDKDIASPQLEGGDAKQTQQALAAGSIFTTAADLDTFIREYSKGINGGKEQEENKLFSKETLQMMHNNVKNGLGGNYDHLNGQVIELGQGGATSGFCANVQHNPVTKKTNVTMTAVEDSGINIGNYMPVTVEPHHNKKGHSIFEEDQDRQLKFQRTLPRGMSSEEIKAASIIEKNAVENKAELAEAVKGMKDVKIEDAGNISKNTSPATLQKKQQDIGK